MNFSVIHKPNGDFDIVTYDNDPRVLKLGPGMIRIDIGLEEGQERCLPMFTAIRPGM